MVGAVREAGTSVLLEDVAGTAPPVAYSPWLLDAFRFSFSVQPFLALYNRAWIIPRASAWLHVITTVCEFDNRNNH
jgi:hypothetical protein